MSVRNGAFQEQTWTKLELKFKRQMHELTTGKDNTSFGN